MDRRSFVKSLAGAGVLIAASELPVIAEDKPEVFPERGKWERLILGYAVVNIGLEKPFSVLHISDTHLSAAYPHEGEKKQTLNARRTKTFGGRQEEALRDTLAWARGNVDYVVHTGDLIDWQSEANFDLVKKYFGDALVTGSVGNHEFSPDMWMSEPKETHTEGFKDNTRAGIQDVYPYDVRFQSQVVNGVNFISLDDVYGYVTKEQVKLFKKEVRKGLPIVLCMHVPFFTPDIWRVTKRYWKKEPAKYTDSSIPEPDGAYEMQLEDKTTRDFIAYLKKEKLLKAILAGHEHLMFEDRFSPTAMQYLVGGNFMFHGREILFI